MTSRLRHISMVRGGRTRGRARWRRGLTFVEFLIAVSITAITAMAVGAVTSSIARGMTSMNDTRSALQRSLVAHARLQAQLIPCLCVLDFDPIRGIVVWQNDDRANGIVNLSELRVLWFEPATGDLTVEWVSFPVGWSEEELSIADLVLTSVDDLFQSMKTQRALGYTTSLVLADGVSALSLSGSGVDLVSSERIRVDLTIGIGEDSERLLMAFGLVNHAAPR